VAEPREGGDPWYGDRSGVRRPTFPDTRSVDGPLSEGVPVVVGSAAFRGVPVVVDWVRCGADGGNRASVSAAMSSTSLLTADDAREGRSEPPSDDPRHRCPGDDGGPVSRPSVSRVSRGSRR
jgi:hypothetical protein